MSQSKRTTATVRRLDGTYTASFVPPMLSLAGAIPDVMKVVYGTFVERYPGIRPDALRAINTNVLAEVGLSINLLDNRIEILLRVDQIGVRAVNLRNDQEVRFVVDCILITHSAARKLAPAITIGSTDNKCLDLDWRGWRSRTGRENPFNCFPTVASKLTKGRKPGR